MLYGELILLSNFLFNLQNMKGPKLCTRFQDGLGLSKRKMAKWGTFGT